MTAKFNIYMLEISINHYWKTAYDGGYITEEIYFTNKEDAKAYAEREINFEYDINDEKVPLMDKRNKGYYNITEEKVF